VPRITELPSAAASGSFMARILVLAGDTTARDTRAFVMELAGYRCETASSLEEALLLLRKHSFDLIVMDSELADDGHNDIVRGLKRASPRAAVIFLARNRSRVPGEADKVVDIPCHLQGLFRSIKAVLAPRTDRDRAMVHSRC